MLTSVAMRYCAFSLGAILTLYPSLTLATSALWLSQWHASDNKVLTMDEQTRDLILDGIQDITFTLEQTTSKRALVRLQESRNVCVSDRIYNKERAQYSLASTQPQVVVPGLKLYVLDAFIKKHNIAPVDLAQLTLSDLLMRYPHFRLGTVAGRSYGKVIDDELAKDAHKLRLWQRSGSDMGEGVIDMLGSKRIDALLEYPPVFEKVREKNAIDTAIHAVSLKEIPEYGVGYVLCSKSDEGEKAIKAISRQLRKVTKQRAYLDVHLSAMPASFKQEMLRYYNEVYGTDFTLNPNESSTANNHQSAQSATQSAVK